jgi:hypothetical protein
MAWRGLGLLAALVLAAPPLTAQEVVGDGIPRR